MKKSQAKAKYYFQFYETFVILISGDIYYFLYREYMSKGYNRENGGDRL